MLSTGLTQDDWEVIEHNNDLLLLAGDLRQALGEGLTSLMAHMHAMGGLLLADDGVSFQPGIWIQHDLSPQWVVQLEDTDSPLVHYAEALFNGNENANAAEVPDLAGGFSIHFNGQSVGALLVQGKPIDSEERLRWAAHLRPFARTIRANQVRVSASNKKSGGENDLPAQSIIPDSELQGAQRRLVREIRDMFQAEDALLVLVDEDNPGLIIWKQLGTGIEWSLQTRLNLENSLVERVIQTGESIVIGDIGADAELNLTLDAAPGLEVKSLLCAPLTSNSRVLGALMLINPAPAQIEGDGVQLYKILVDALAGYTLNNRELQALKIANASLEASLWELMNSRNTLRSLFDSLPTSVYIIDRSYTMIAVNMHRSTRAGIKPQQLVGKKCHEKLYNRSAPCPGCRVAETLALGTNTTRTSREWLNNDQYIEWEITSFPIQEKNNVPHQVILFEEDITEKRNLENNVIQSEKLAAVGQLAAGLAHEINNPLAAIIANTQLLLASISRDDEDAIDSLKLIETAGVRASQVVSNLLGVARAERGYTFELTSLNETIQSALSLVHHEIVNHGIKLELDLADDLPDLVASRNHLQGVWINLVVNAVDAVPSNTGVIRIHSGYHDKNFIVTITDNGKGIAQENLTRIFEPFFTTKNVGRGTGLGLSVCMQVIKHHDGTIQVDSHPGMGTVFRVILPDIPRL